MMDPQLTQAYLGLSAILFTIGVAGALMRRNVLIVLMSIELMLNAANIAFVAFGRARGDTDGLVMPLFVIVLAAIEAAIGLAIVVALYRDRGTPWLDEVDLLKE